MTNQYRCTRWSRQGLHLALLLAGFLASPWAHAAADLRAALNGPATYTPGESGTYTLALTNPGDASSAASTVALTFPAGITGGTWICTTTGASTCGTPANSTGNLSRSGVVVTAGGSVTFTNSAAYAYAAGPASQTVTATVSGVTTPLTTSATRIPISDVSVTMASTPTRYTPGDTGSFTIRATNAGPDPVSGVVLAYTAPANVVVTGWSCATAAGGATCPNTSASGNISQTLTLPATGSLQYTVNVAYASSLLIAQLTHNASVNVPAAANDPDSTDHTASVQLTIERKAAIRVTKRVRLSDSEPPTASATIGPGAFFRYEILVENIGPGDVGHAPPASGNAPDEGGILLTDTFSNQLINDPVMCGGTSLPCWEYCSLPSDPADTSYTIAECSEVRRGAGNIADVPFKLPAGSSSLLVVYAAVGQNVIGTVNNTATVALPPGITLTGPAADRTSSASVTVVAGTDIAVQVDDGVTTAVPGTPHTYTVKVRNSGFVTANNVAVDGLLPILSAPGDAGFVAASGSWQCSATGNACCNHNSNVCGTGGVSTPVVFADGLATHVDLPSQGEVTFTVRGTLHPRAAGTVSYSVTGTAPAGVQDTNPLNNTGSDANTVLNPQAGFRLEKTLLDLTEAPGEQGGAPYQLDYRITITNSGPSFVTGALVEDLLDDAGLDSASATWTCSIIGDANGSACPTPATGTGPINALVDIAPGSELRFDLKVSTTAVATNPVTNTARISAPAGNASDTVISGLVGQADLTIEKNDFRTEVTPGDSTEYVITVTNKGPDDVFGARVTDAFPPQLDNVTWSCKATTPVPGNLQFVGFAGTAGTTANGVVLTADGRHAYQVGAKDGRVYAFVRNAVPGRGFGDVTLLETETNGVNDNSDSGPVVSGMREPIDLVLSPDGTMLYVLTPHVPEVPAVPAAPGVLPVPAIPATPAAIAAFNRVTNAADPSFGRLSFAGATTAGVPVAARRVVMTDNHLYVSGDSQVSIYRRDVVSSLPMFVVAHTAALPATPGAMAVSLGDGMLFVAGSSGGIAQFAINPTAGANYGRLSTVASVGSGNSDFAGITDLAIAPAERHLYAAAGSARRLLALKWGGAGDFALAAPAYVSNDASDPLSGHLSIALAPDGEHIIGVNRTRDILFSTRRDVFSGGLSGTSGSLFTELFQFGAEHPELAKPSDVAVTPDGRHVLIASAAEAAPARQMVVYARRAPDPLFAFVEADRQGDEHIGENGQVSAIDGLVSPTDVAVSRDNSHVYALSLQDGSLSVFRRYATRGESPDTAGGHLEFIRAYRDGQTGVSGGVISGLARANRLLLSPDGQSVFVSSEDNNTVAVFDRKHLDADANFGQLGFRQLLKDGVGGVDGLLGAQGMAMDSASQHLYVSGSFEAAIAIFKRNGANLSYVGVVKGGSNGVTGMVGIRDLQVTGGGGQVLGVSASSNALVVFNRDAVSASETFGALTFVQAQALGANERPMALSLTPAISDNDVSHVYVVAQNTNRIHVLSRVVDPTSTAYGTVRPQRQYNSASAGFSKLVGPRDIVVSPNGKRVYVAAQFSHSVLVLDRDTNRSSSNFGGLSPVEVRTNQVDGVDGLDSVYAVAASNDLGHVYAAGFGDSAIASFAIGSGSSCSVGGAGDIDDVVDIGVNGTLVYRASARVLPGATGILSNTAHVIAPDRTVDPSPGNNASTDVTTLTVSGDLSIDKNNDQVSVIGGQRVNYTLDVRNAGPSNVVNGPGHAVNVTDLFDSVGAGANCAAGLLPDTATWTCSASGSGALNHVATGFGPVAAGSGPPAPIGPLGGISGLVLIPDSDAGGPLGAYLAAASVTDHNVTIFRRATDDGVLSQVLQISNGQSLHGTPIDSLDGARSVWASSNGRFLYVGSRGSDAITTFALGESNGALSVTLLQVQRNILGLDQVLHLGASPDGKFLYASGANDDAIAVFARDADTGLLTHVESEQDGVNDPSDPGNAVVGLGDVEFTVVSPDGAHLYALSGSGASVAIFNRDVTTGRLSWRSVRTGSALNVPLDGVSSAVFDDSGEYLYLTAANANRIVVLRRTLQPGGTFGDLALSSSVVQDSNGVMGLLTPRRAVLSGDGRHLYVTGQGGGSVAWFGRDPNDGRLRFLGQRTNESSGVDGLSGATGVVIDNALNQVYVAGTLQRAIVHFRREVDSFCPPSGSGPLNAVPVNIAAGGALTFQISVDVRSDLDCDLVNEASVHSDSDSNPGNNSDSHENPINAVADVSITKDDGLAEFDGLSGARAIAGDARHLYVAAPGDNALGVFTRQHDVGLADVGAARFAGVVRSGVNGVAGLSGVADVLLSNDGVHLYAVASVDNAITSFARNATTGALSYIDIDQNGVLGVSAMSGARALAQSPDGAHLYVASEFSNGIALFRRDMDAGSATYGRLTFHSAVQNGVVGVAGIEAPIAVLVSPDGKHVYGLGTGTDSVALFNRNPSTGSANFGQLSYVSHLRNANAGVTGMAGVRSLAMDASGTHLYVLAAGSGNLVHFTRNASSGALTFVAATPGNGLSGASRLRLSPDGSAMYVAGTTGDTIVRFVIDGASGAPTFAGQVTLGDDAPLTGGQVLALDGVSDVLVSPDGEQLYSVASLDDALGVFERDPAAAADASGLDFSGAIFDGLGGVAPGDPVTYTITVRNAGPSFVHTARVVDNFPAQFASVQWTCSGGGGGQCVASGNGNIDSVVQLPVGGSVVFLATGVVADNASGRLVNTATVTPVGVLDPIPTNNAATDGDTVLSPKMDLVTTMTDGDNISVPGGRVDYDVRIANLGPSYANAVTLHDSVPAALYDVAWSCSPVPLPGVLAPVGALFDPLAQSTYAALAFDPLGRHVYGAAQRNGVGAVVLWRRDPLSGMLLEHAVYLNGTGNVRGISGATDVVLSRDARFVYVAGRASDSIALFSRNAESGELTFVSQYQDGELGIDGLGGVSTLQFSADGRHLYAGGSSDDAIVTFSVNASSGALTSLALTRQGQNGVDGLNGVRDLAFSADGNTLFAIATENESLAAFTRNPSTGVLTFRSAVLNFELGDDALLDPSALLVAGGRIFVASAGGDMVGIFAFEDGVLSLEDSIVAGLDAPRALAWDADQARLYVASAGNGQVQMFSLLGATPQLLASYSSASHAVLTGVTALGMSTDGKQLYTAAGVLAGGVGVWSRERGSRCAVAGTRTLEGLQVDIAPGGSVDLVIGGDIFANALGTLTYSVTADTRVPEEERNPPDNTATDINTLQPNPDLSISKTDNRSDVVAGLPVSYDVAVANAGLSDAIAARLTDAVPQFPGIVGGLRSGEGRWTCAANAPLEFIAEHTAATLPDLAGVTEMAATRDASRLYAVNPSRNALLVFALDAAGALGAPTAIVDGAALGEATVSGLRGASHVAVSPDGRQVFVTGATDNSLVVFDVGIDPDTGAVTHRLLHKLVSGVDNVAGMTSPAQVTVSRDGRFVYVASPGADSIAVFRHEVQTGKLVFVERARDGFGNIVPESNVIRGVRRVRLSDDGRQLYAVALGSQAITTFDIDATSGRLTFRQVIRHATVPGLAGVRDVVAAPGDTYLYAMGTGAVAQFQRGADGRLIHVQSFPFAGHVAQPTALRLDAHGSRMYVADAAGAVHVYARDWSSGALEHRHRFGSPASALSAPASLLLVPVVPALSELYVASPDAAGGIVQLSERALSRCLENGAVSDNMELDIDLGATGWAHLQFDGMVHPSARGTLTNVATIAPGSGVDPDPANNTATDNSTILVVSDIAVQKTAPADGVAGEAIEYRIEVSNAGPSDALGMRVVDDLHAAVLDATWTCSATGDSLCAASGSGDPDVAADLLVGETLTIVVTARIDPAFIGELPNLVTLIPEPGATDPTTGDHTSSTVTTVIAIADVAVSKTNNTESSVAGTPVQYIIDVTNAGPSDSPLNRVLDPAAEFLRDIQWTCVPTGTATCPANGSGGIDANVSVPAGASVRFTIDAQLIPSASGTLTNRVDVLVQAPTNEPDVSNNVAVDTDTIAVNPDLSLALIDPLDPFDPHGAIDLPYMATVRNLGPSDARNVTLDLSFSHPITQTLPEGCVIGSGSTLRCELGYMLAGQTITVPFGFRNLPAAPSTLTIDGLVSTTDDDLLQPNNSASQTTTMTTGGDVMVSIDDKRVAVNPGDELIYKIEIFNIGSVGVPVTPVSLPVPPELVNVTWTCQTNTDTVCANGSGNLTDTLDLDASVRVTYTLRATVDPALDPSIPRLITMAVSALPEPAADINFDNNQAQDVDVVQFVIFHDDFEAESSNRFWLPKRLFELQAGCARNDDAGEDIAACKASAGGADR